MFARKLFWSVIILKGSITCLKAGVILANLKDSGSAKRFTFSFKNSLHSFISTHPFYFIKYNIFIYWGKVKGCEKVVKAANSVNAWMFAILNDGL